MYNSKRTTICFALLCLQVSQAAGAESGDAFEFFREEATVVTASRREESIGKVPMAVDVITADEIKTSGAVNVWELLRFRLGMDVLEARSLDGNRAAVSVRGFAQEFADNLQVLIDGRSVYKPITNGTLWDQLPVQMQDIDRIEIIRGPNAALYGTGAGLGVVNIITKKPEGPTQGTGKVFGGNRNRVQTEGAVQSTFKELAYRLSYTFKQDDGFPFAGGGDDADHLRSQKANFRTQWTPADATHLEFFTGASWNHQGIVGAAPGPDRFTENFQMVKISQKLGESSTLEGLTSRSDGITGRDDIRVVQYDEELLHRLDWWDNRLNTTYGVNYRHAAVSSTRLFSEAPNQKENLWNGYVHQTIQVHSKLSLSGAAAWESTNVGQARINSNFQAATLWTPFENHSLRASYSVAHTDPSVFNAFGRYRLASGILLVGNPDLAPQKITSYELGYRGVASRQWQFETSFFYSVIQNIPMPVVVVAPPFVTAHYESMDQAIARGVETQLTYRFSAKRSLYINHTYEFISDWVRTDPDITRNTPAHKVNFGGVTDMGYGFTGSFNVGYKDKYEIDSDGLGIRADVPAYWRVDARLAYTVNPNVELFVAGQNLASHGHIEFADTLEVPRTYQGGISVKFGGKP